MAATTPRVLRIEFELRVPPGLRANIQSGRIESAVLALQSAVQSVAGSVFPWADQIRVRWAWSYEWWAPEPTVLTLPATDKNTVQEADTDTEPHDPS